MKTTKTFFQKALSMLLTAAMVVTLFTVAAPTEAQAAGLSFKGKGTSAVTIKDSQCYNKKGDVTVNYIKYKPAVTGTVTLKFQNASKDYSYSYGYITLCDKNKKAIGQKEEYWNNGVKNKVYYTTTYGVKKNTTYYFAVKCASGTKITATTKAVKDSSASSKSKAKSLAKGKAVTGIITNGDGKADWYKIKVNNEKIKITLSAETNGDDSSNGIKMTFYDKNGKVFTDNNKNKAITWVTRASSSTWWKIYTSNGSTKYGLPSGTYYIKIERKSKASSGSYKLTWNKY